VEAEAAGEVRRDLKARTVSAQPMFRPSDQEALAAVRRARDLIDRDFGTPLDLDVLAGEAGYSKFHFARLFAAAYGETPRAYLSRRRIERAKNLLRTANLSVTEICLLVGFESLGSFSARFRALVGQSPSTYRAEIVRTGGPPPIPGCFLLVWTRPAEAPSAEPQAARSPTAPPSPTVAQSTTESTVHRRTTP
jgi:AraC-like DNA-binding protein